MSCKFLVMVILLIAAAPLAFAAKYQVIIDEKGSALVLIEVIGVDGEIIPLPEDVQDVKVSGALYIVENGSLELQLTSKEEASVIFRTDMLTKKEENWMVSMLTVPGSSVELYLPLDITVSSTEPRALVEQEEFTIISWSDTDHIQSEYSFSSETLPDITGDVTSTIPKRSYRYIWIILILMILAVPAIMILRPSRKENIIKTLPKNERNIMKIMKDNRGRMRRNELERSTRLAKSSLAASLNNLENKKIIRIDRTHTVHIISFTRWFRKL